MWVSYPLVHVTLLHQDNSRVCLQHTAIRAAIKTNKQKTKKEHEANKPSETTTAAATTTKAATTTRKKSWRGLTLERKQQALLANAKVPAVVRKC